MTVCLSATDVAIAVALQFRTLRVVDRKSRFGGYYTAIEDNHGLIEIANDQAEADKRISEVRDRANAANRAYNAKRFGGRE